MVVLWGGVWFYERGTPGVKSGGRFRKVDVRLPGKGNSNSHGARPVHLIITMIKWIRTSRLSIKNSLSGGRSPLSAAVLEPLILLERRACQLLLLPLNLDATQCSAQAEGT